MLNRSLLASASLFCLIVIPGLARADVAPSDICDSTAAAGTACQNAEPTTAPGKGQPGTCQSASCSGNDYANWDRDASAVPPQRSYPCLLCKAKGAGPADAAAPVAVDAGNGSTLPDAGTSDPSSGADKSSGCSVASLGQAHPSHRTTLWLLAGAIAVVFNGRRRRS
jgi:hypothetical protein